MDSEKLLEKFKEEVANYTNKHTDATDGVKPLVADDVFVVWSCKALQNFKAVLSTPRADGMYYECTYNGNKNEFYFDAYKKFENRCIEL